MPTSTVSIVITSDDVATVYDYVRDCIDNADQDWGIESATIETDDITTDLLEDEEDLSDESDELDTAEEAAEKAGVEEEGTDQETPSEDAESSKPTGKEF